jgi:serine/threonine-protein kinase SRPK3
MSLITQNYKRELSSENHFQNVMFEQLSQSDSEHESDTNSESSVGSFESGSGSESGSDSESDSEYASDSESGSESDSELQEMNPDDLFNTKTNGHEFFGEVLKNRYLILKKLGYGSFSSVWMAYDVENKSLVAIKIINPQDYKEGMLELQTYKRLEKLDCTYLLTMIECFQVTPIHNKYYEEEYKSKNKKERNHIVMILPLMACSTFDLLKCNVYEDGLPLEVSKEIIYQTLLGVKELEKHNLMHTDLKPENILVCGLNREAELLLEIISNIDIKTLHESQLDKVRNNVGVNIWLESYKLYKDITKTIIQFMKKEMHDIKDQMKDCKVQSKYIKDICIKICDFNLVLDAKENIGDDTVEIQTRYYRSPEIILGHGLHSKTDYWSIGCILFELLTGDILFDPEKDKLRSRDVHHLYLIEELIGSIPINMIKESTNKDRLYDKKGNLVNVDNKIKRWNLTEVFKENHDNLALEPNIMNRVIKFIESTLQINPNNRPNIKSLLDTIQKIVLDEPLIKQKDKLNVIMRL